MISVTEYDNKVSDKENLIQCIIPKTLLLTKKNKYTELRDPQRYRTVIIRKPGGHKYKFEFELSLEDTALTQMFLYQKNFTSLPKNTVLLWVCSIRKQKSKKPEIFKISDLDWHFSVVETNQELNCKHKGIISKLQKNDLLLSAGEFYITADQILWNNVSGCLKKSMLLNESLIERSFIEAILNPIFLTFPEKFEYKNDLLKTYAPVVTYEYCNKLHKKNILSNSDKEKICGC
jgi:hypothetical protein